MKRRDGGRLIVLAYHRVGDAHDFVSRGMGGSGIPVNRFARQMEFLKRHYRVRTLSDAVTDPPENGQTQVVVTFDDGYKDNHTHAWPVLRGLGLPATIFAVSDVMGGDALIWQHKLYYLKDVKGETWLLRQCGSDGDFGALMRDMRARGDTAVRDVLLNRLWYDAGLDAAQERALAQQLYLSREDMREMSDGGVEFGAHTRTHARLSSLHQEDLRREIAGSKKRLEEILQGVVGTFAYPYGDADSYHAAAEEEVRRAGYKAACTTLWGENRLAPDTDWFRLRRKGMNYAYAWQMRLELSGLKDKMRRWIGRPPA